MGLEMGSIQSKETPTCPQGPDSKHGHHRACLVLGPDSQSPSAAQCSPRGTASESLWPPWRDPVWGLGVGEGREAPPHTPFAEAAAQLSAGSTS